MRLTIDFETRSPVDLRKTGVWVYSEHPETDVQCLAVKVDDQPGRIWVWPYHLDRLPVDHGLPLISREAVADLLALVDVIEAHNLEFERALWTNCLAPKHGFPPLPLDKCRCSAAKAASFALPRHLDGACRALRLPVQKDQDGYRLMLKLCKPRKPTKHNTARWHETPEDVIRLCRYCLQDVEAEYALSSALRDLPPEEQRVWALDQTINARGILADVQTARKVLGMIARHEARLLAEVKELTASKVDSVRQVAALVAHLEQTGCEMDDLRRKTVEEALGRDDLAPEARRLLEIRLSLSKSSTAKYQALIAQACRDGRVRGNLLYHGAATGRWAGRGVQLQNLPRISFKDMALALETVQTGNLDLAALLYSDPMDLFSACIRPMFMAAPGKDLIACDFASIEARVLLWLAQDEDALGVFRRGEDIYCDMASFIYGRPITKKDKAERQLGKTAILGLGYQMGAKKFLETCAKDPVLRALGVQVDAATAERVVNGYREKFALVKRLWTETNRAAVQAVQTRQPVAVGRVKFAVWGGFLHCRLPSGRLLSYCNPYIETVETGSGLREQLGFWSVNSITKKWERTKTYGGKLVENIDQATSRDLMAEAMLRVEAAGYPVVLTVHDEVVSEVDEGFGSVEAYEALMVQAPAWAEGIPVAAEGWRGKRYRK